ncbi:MAG TPA: BON domain-containing protein [Burkholderiaceae bacterium]|jgi:osmotically-inducible protein OsmY
MNTRTWTLTALGAGIVGASLALAGCDKGAQPSPRSTADQSVAQADTMTRAKRDMSALGDKVDDAAITASVKTALARDSDLSALQINVDTDNGRVALRGTAPTAGAKDHATSLASGVKGVSGVDNQLTVAPK